MIPADRVAEKTIAQSVELKGRGLHTGAPAMVRLEPAPEGTGLCFFRSDAGSGTPAAGFSAEGAERRSRVGDGDDSVETVEHLAAAAAGLGVLNLNIRVDGPEIPAMDGSAAPFVDAMARAGIREQKGRREVWGPREIIFCARNTGSGGRGSNAAIAVFPCETFRVTYTLDYDHPQLSEQTVSFEIREEVFRRELAGARTFCTEAEAAALRARGFGRGADTSNTLVIGGSGPIQNTLRFPDECARHKALDLVGDLALLGFPVRGHFVAVRSGHALNRALARKIIEQRGEG